VKHAGERPPPLVGDPAASRPSPLLLLLLPLACECLLLLLLLLLLLSGKLPLLLVLADAVLTVLCCSGSGLS